jgi:hypothetical protein
MNRMAVALIFAAALPARAEGEPLREPAPAPASDWRLYTAIGLAGAGAAAFGLTWYFNYEVAESQAHADAIVARGRREALSTAEYRALAADLEETNADGAAYQSAASVSLVLAILFSAGAGGTLLSHLFGEPAASTPQEPESFRLDVGPLGLSIQLSI